MVTYLKTERKAMGEIIYSLSVQSLCAIEIYCLSSYSLTEKRIEVAKPEGWKPFL
jgi:hypothetical protein